MDRAAQSYERLPSKPALPINVDDYPLHMSRRLPLRVADSISFSQDGKRYRLTGLATVPSGKICKDDVGQRWACGLRARAALSGLLSGREIRCAPRGERDGFLLVECVRAGKDLGATLAGQGNALSASDAYEAVQDDARKRGVGVWAPSAPTN